MFAFSRIFLSVHLHVNLVHMHVYIHIYVCVYMCIDFVQTHARYVCNCIRVSLMCMHYIIKKTVCIFGSHAYTGRILIHVRFLPM